MIDMHTILKGFFPRVKEVDEDVIKNFCNVYNAYAAFTSDSEAKARFLEKSLKYVSSAPSGFKTASCENLTNFLQMESYWIIRDLVDEVRQDEK